MSVPSYGQRSDPHATPNCPRHPGVRSVDYCKCRNRPMRMDCTIPIEVRSIYVDCTSLKKWWMGSASRAATIGTLVVTYAMTAICILVYVVTLPAPIMRLSLAFVPAWLMAYPWTALTGAFLHGGIMHVLSNMLSLYWVGRAIESVLGRWHFLTLYLVSALGDSAFILVWCFIQPSGVFVSTVGVSGAVFGLLGAVFALRRLGGPDTTVILMLLGINPAYGSTVSGISWQGHIDGVIAGVGATWVLMHMARLRPGVMQVHQNRRETVVAFSMIAGMPALSALASCVLYEVYGA